MKVSAEAMQTITYIAASNSIRWCFRNKKQADIQANRHNCFVYEAK